MTQGQEVYRRAAAGRAYYALMLEGREALARWGIVPAPRENVHTFVRLRFHYAADADLKTIGNALDQLGRLRNRADYDLNAPQFLTDVDSQVAVANATAALALLDAVEGDPARRAAAGADIRARWP